MKGNNMSKKEYLTVDVALNSRSKPRHVFLLKECLVAALKEVLNMECRCAVCRDKTWFFGSLITSIEKQSKCTINYDPGAPWAETKEEVI